VSQTWFRGHGILCSSNSTVPIVPHHHHVLRWDWHSDPPSGTIRQSFTSNYYSHLSQGRNQCLDMVRGQFGTCSSNSTVPIVPYHHVLRWDWHFRSTHWHHDKASTTTPHLSQGRIQCRRRGSGANRHMQLKFYRSSVPPPPPCAAVGLALQIHPLVP
jgi:hypothetical protein